jgi:hypothetical protein
VLRHDAVPSESLLRALIAGAALALVAGCAGFSNLPRADLVADIDWSGLEPVEVKGIDIAYVSPAANLAVYDRVMLDPLEVSFAEQWDPSRPGSPFSMSERELENLRQDIAGALEDAFKSYMDRDRRYPVVPDPGPGVLRIRARVVDVFLNAPGIQSAGRTDQYAHSFGELTLVAELIDGESGALLGRLVDRWIDPEGRLERYTWVENNLALQRAMESWAESLQRYLNVVNFRQGMSGVGEGIRKADDR